MRIAVFGGAYHPNRFGLDALRLVASYRSMGYRGGESLG
jgi:hypothetical protein